MKILTCTENLTKNIIHLPNHIMNKNIIAVFIIITAACNSNSTYTVHVEDGNDISAFSNSIKELELIPLSTDDTHLLGTQTDLIPTDDGFIVLDVPNSKIYHYDQSGTFINAIGRKGRGPGEYNSLLNVELAGDSLYVFSAPQKMQCFSLDGKLLSEKKDSIFGQTMLHLPLRHSELPRLQPYKKRQAERKRPERREGIPAHNGISSTFQHIGFAIQFRWRHCFLDRLLQPGHLSIQQSETV